MSAPDALSLATNIGLAVLGLALLLAILRLVLGPTLPDRILALDVITTLALGFIAVFAINTGFTLYLDIAIAIGLLGFLSTIAFARYVLRSADAGRTAPEGDS